MIDDWVLWLLLVGLAVGAAGMAMITVRLPREDDDLGADERRMEADWIAATIERHGGIAPASLVEEVLELHGAYLASVRPPAPDGASAPPVPPPWPSTPVVPGPAGVPGSAGGPGTPGAPGALPGSPLPTPPRATPGYAPTSPDASPPGYWPPPPADSPPGTSTGPPSGRRPGPPRTGTSG